MARPTATVLLGIALCLVAAAFDAPSLYLPGVAVAVVAALCGSWTWLAASAATLARAPVPATVVEGEPFRVRVEARLDRLPAPGGELSDPLLDRVRPVAGRSRVVLEGAATLPRRGRTRLPPSLLTVRDPLGLGALRTLGSDGPELLALPRVEPVTATTAGGHASAGELARLLSRGRLAASRDGPSDGLDLDGLRPYREGTPATRIHWATLARRGEMMERRFVAASAASPLVVLDAAPSAGEAALDAAVRATASLCVALARSGGVALLLPGDRRPVELDRELLAWPALHRRLALVEAGPRPRLGGLGTRSGALLWVSAAGEAVPAELARLPLRPRYLVAPSLPAGAVPELAVAGCGVLALDRDRRPRAAA